MPQRAWVTSFAPIFTSLSRIFISRGLSGAIGFFDAKTGFPNQTPCGLGQLPALSEGALWRQNHLPHASRASRLDQKFLFLENFLTTLRMAGLNGPKPLPVTPVSS
jgi:hypothetical protein